MQKIGKIIQSKIHGQYLKFIHNESEDGFHDVHLSYSDRIEDATVFSSVSTTFFGIVGTDFQENHMVREVKISKEISLIDEWVSIKDSQPRNYQEVRIKIGNGKRKAIWNSEIHKFVDSGSLAIIEDVEEWQGI